MIIPYVLASMLFLIIMFLSALPGLVLLFLSISVDLENLSIQEWINNGTMLIFFIFIAIPAIYVSIRVQFIM